MDTTMSTTESGNSMLPGDETTTSTSHFDVMTRSVAPSHILQNGRFVHLPPPSNLDRGHFLERSIAKHGLLQHDLTGETQKQEKDDDEEDSDSLQVHPLAVASARLNAQGIAEMSKAINLSGLVTAGDYFGLSNIVDPNLELVNDKKKDTPPSSTTNKPSTTTTAATSTPTTATSTTSTTTTTIRTADAQLRATFIGKRKRSQFLQATDFLETASQRMAHAMTAQSIMDDRLVQLRKRWRFVAPEHGTRAKPHPVRSTEVVAIDVHVYDRDRTGGGNLALKQLDGEMGAVQGRIARRVPRYATVELQDSFQASQHVEAWKQGASQQEIDRMDTTMDQNDKENTTNEESVSGDYTRCEPFAVADPTLGKINAHFDPDKVPMLTLELAITKASSGFEQSSCLTPTMDYNNHKNATIKHADEQVVMTLQHSLFCASLFESIRKELQQDTQDHVWLASEAQETFLPPPLQMAGSVYNGDVATLSVVHCHEGEVKVQLDSEYVLTVKLVEAGTAVEENKTNAMQVQNDNETTTTTRSKDHGSQTPQELLVLCRALLLHIQSVYHDHCVKTGSSTLQELQENESAPGLARIQKKNEIPSPFILQNCVSFGSKMLLQGKIRRACKRIAKWLKQDMHTNDPLVVEWLPLSVFEPKSQFTLMFRDFLVDVTLNRSGMNVTCCGQDEYKSVTFNSNVEFELFVKFEIQKRLQN